MPSPSRPASLALLLLVGAACGPTEPEKKEPRVLLRLGNACTGDGDCGSRLCLRGTCARWCSSQVECPEGFDCGRQAAEDPGGSCYPAAYPQPELGGFGTDCSLFAKGCGAGPDPCAEGFSCRAALACDPQAICTKSCAADGDCPPAMFCGTENDRTTRVCMKRVACTPCIADDQCPANHVCAWDVDGGRYCAKTCEIEGDCRKPEKDSDTGQSLFEPFERCLPDPMGKGNVCRPSSGRCFGASTLAGFEGTGALCSGCRVGHPEDCAEGLRCIEAPSGERFCTQKCQIELSQGRDGQYRITDDTCPEGAYCYLGGSVPQGCGSRCRFETICSADSSYMSMSCYPPLD